jgi:hypothetical protein
MFTSHVARVYNFSGMCGYCKSENNQEMQLLIFNYLSTGALDIYF